MKRFGRWFAWLRQNLTLDRLGRTLFWVWNLTFLCFMLLGFGPALLPEILPVALEGELPWAFLGLVLALTALPVLVSLLAWWRLRDSGSQLLTLGFGVEGPLMALLALRIFGVREANPAMALLLGLTALGPATVLWQLVDRDIEERSAPWQALRWLLSCLMALVGIYVAVWAAFYLLPGLSLLAGIVEELPDLLREWVRELGHAPLYKWPFITLLPPVLLMTVLLTLALPLCSLATWLAGSRRAFRAARPLLSRRTIGAVALTALLALPAVFLQAARQPQQPVFAALADPPVDLTAMRALTAKDETIRLGLVNAYLGGLRYIGARGGVDHVRWMYRDDELLGLSWERAEAVQAAYEFWISPLLYRPVADKPQRADERQVADAERAAELYRQHFDRPILEAERSVIARTVAANWDLERAFNNRLAVDDREVWVAERGLTVLAAEGGWAELELHEVYHNQTFQQQEVLYAFSLPESAVITGLWLGEFEDPATRQAFTVAPRGAAQQVYREERQRRVDPALIEQLGPRQYRLRAFPVPPRQWGGETGARLSRPGQPLHLWLRFVVPAMPVAKASAALPSDLLGSGTGGEIALAWPLPVASDQRNAYWNRATRWELPEGVSAPRDGAWLPSSIPAEGAGAQPVGATVDLAGWTVNLEPRDAASAESSSGDAGSGPGRITVLLDRSRSMEGVAGEVGQSLAALKALQAEGRLALVELLLSAPEASGQQLERASPAGLRPDQLWTYGGQDPAELLRDLATSDGPRDALFVLSDASAFTADLSVPGPWTQGPLWWVHLGGAAPSYPDALQDLLLTSGGGTASSLVEALDRWRVRAAPAAGSMVDQVDGWQVRLSRNDGLAEIPDAADRPLRRVAARQLLQAEARRLAGAAPTVADLDALHRLAKDEGIVSPFSSMIVLVNDAQRRRLEELSEAEDRFERELETEPAVPEDVLAVTAVPEPGEWLLMAVALLLLWLQGGRRRSWRMG